MEGWCLLVNHRVDSLINTVNETFANPKGNYYVKYFEAMYGILKYEHSDERFGVVSFFQRCCWFS